MSQRHRVTKHLIRRTARAELRRLKHLQLIAASNKYAAEELKALGIRPETELHVKPAGRIRARWVVATGFPAQ